MTAGAVRWRVLLVNPVVLLASLFPSVAAGPPAGPSPDFTVALGEPTLQVSPELTEVRPGVSVKLTARISHSPGVPLDVDFEVSSLESHPRDRRALPDPPSLRCTVTPPGETCSVTLSSPVTSVVLVRAWISGEGRPGPDRREGRLASLALPPRAEADCRLEDGEPFDDSCRRDGAGGVVPGSTREPDGTDVVLVAWTGFPPVVLDCGGAEDAGELEVRPPDDRTVRYLCEVRNRRTGEPVIGIPIDAEIMGGPFDPDGGEAPGPGSRADYGDEAARDKSTRRLCSTTAPQGRCSFELTVPGEGPGRAVICFWADGNSNGAYDHHEFDGGGCVDEAPDEVEGNDGTDAVVVEFRSA